VRHFAIALVAGMVVGAFALATGGEPARREYEPRPPAGSGVAWVAIGDFGTGGRDQRRIARDLCDLHEIVAFDHVVTTGDNVYDSGDPDDFKDKFFDPYDCLFDEGVSFRAVLGNHDVVTNDGKPELNEPRFGMDGHRYRWRLGPVRFLMFDSNRTGRRAMRWLRTRLTDASGAPWTIVVMHHPVYSGGTGHGHTPGFANKFAGRFAYRGVDLVLHGHDHVYSRARKRGVTYVVTGGGGAGLYGCADPLPKPVKTCESEHHFLDLRATKESLSVTAVAVDGTVLERVDVRRNR
jgi:3',5'-cyclic AMP phosphodiesterase CpdA